MSLPEQFGRYRLIKRLATGGMGEVFLARHTSSRGQERWTVVKRMLPQLADDPGFAAWFRREGRIAALQNHPNIVQTYEVGRVGCKEFIAMEYVEGPTLVRLLAAALNARKRLSIALSLHLSIGIARALEHIHTRESIAGDPLQIVHMDLAPHNVIVTADGDAKILDFGIARAGAPDEKGNRRTFRGRTAYLAPEQLDGLQLDQRVDLFAAGVIMHEMVVGHPLFRAHNDQATATRILHARVGSPRLMRPEVPASLDRIIMRALARDRDQRYRRAAEMLQELDGCALTHRIVTSTSAFRAELALLAAAVGEEQKIAGAPTASRAGFEASITTLG